MLRLISVLIAVVFLSANLHLTHGKHMCGGKSVKESLMFGLNDLGCGMAEEVSSCELKKVFTGERLDSKPCCNNELSVYKINEAYKQVKRFVFSWNQQLFTLPIQTSCSNFFSFLVEIRVPVVAHAPPILGKEILILIQTFLI